MAGDTLATATAERISIREFARRVGCNDKVIRRAIERGSLPVDGDHKLDAAQVDAGWRRTDRRRPTRPPSPHEPSGALQTVLSLEEAARTFVAKLDGSGFDQFLANMLAGKLADLHEAVRIKENALALKHLLAARREALLFTSADRDQSSHSTR